MQCTQHFIGLLCKQAFIVHHLFEGRGKDKWKICKLHNMSGPVKNNGNGLAGRYK
jgi:hypothetical protein